MSGLSGDHTLVIPVANSTLGVAVPLDALPDDEADVLQILQAEQAPLGLWLDFAKAYLQQGRDEQARRMLEDGCSDGAPCGPGLHLHCLTPAATEIEQYYGDAKAERVALLCASASFYTRLVREAPPPPQLSSHIVCRGAWRRRRALGTPCTSVPTRLCCRRCAWTQVSSCRGWHAATRPSPATTWRRRRGRSPKRVRAATLELSQWPRSWAWAAAPWPAVPRRTRCGTSATCCAATRRVAQRPAWA